MSVLHPEVIAAAKAHAIETFPEEACGFVVGNTYWPATNVALPVDQHQDGNPTCGCRLCAFTIAPEEFLRAEAAGLDAILHSHPNGPMFPSALDMQMQIQSGVPWGIIVTDGERASNPVMWGDTLPLQPLIGRSFIHGVSDCYSLIRDVYRLGAAGLARQEITEWPFEQSILLPEVPRDDNWWAGGKDLYVDHFEAFGFREIPREDARPGDIFLMRIRSQRLNHGGLLIGNGLILHHLPGRLSRREPAGIWFRGADLWIRRVDA